MDRTVAAKKLFLLTDDNDFFAPSLDFAGAMIDNWQRR